MTNYYRMERNLDRDYIIERINHARPYINLRAICRYLNIHSQNVNATLKSNGTKYLSSTEDLKRIADFLDIL